MNNMTIKAKLILLMAAAIFSLLATGLAGILGISATTNAVQEIGVVRLPSVLGLEIMKNSRTAVAASARRVAFFENDYRAQAKFDDSLKEIEHRWTRYDEGLKIYEPLPQTPDEAVLWKQYVEQSNAYRSGIGKVEDIIKALSRRQSETEQQTLYVQFYQAMAEVFPLF